MIISLNDHKEQPNTLTIQINVVESHLTVTVPSTSLSQKQEPEIFNPQSAFCMIIQLAINLKFLLTVVIALRIYVMKIEYIIAYLICPDLGFINIVVLIC
jgi:hypothetical protein